MFRSGVKRGLRAHRPFSLLGNVSRLHPQSSQFVVSSFSSFPCHFFSTSKDEEPDTMQIGHDILDKAKYRAVVDTLTSENRVKISKQDFLSVCEKHNVVGEEATNLLSSLHDSGVVLHYTNSKILNNVVFLKVDDLVKPFLKILDADGSLSKSFVENSQKELAELEEEHSELEAQSQAAWDKGMKRTDLQLNAGLALLVGQGAVVARLTWWELSWDIMEPVTYMITFTCIVGGFAYFIRTGNEYTYEHLRERMARNKQKKILQKQGFPSDRFEQIKARIVSLKDHLKTPELALLGIQSKFIQEIPSVDSKEVADDDIVKQADTQKT